VPHAGDVSQPAASLALVLTVAAAVGILLLVAFLRHAARARRLPYFSREFLLTRGEAAFYRVLRGVVPDGLTLCFKVRLCDLIDCAPDARAKGFWSKIAQKHIDFVLVDAADTAIRLAIELDDRSHDRKDRRDRDAFVDGALAVAGIPVLRVPAAAEYDAKEVRRLLDESLRRKARRAA
jgi:very-short-patch-repair endonuclease